MTFSREQQQLGSTRELLSACPRYAALDFRATRATKVLIDGSGAESSWMLMVLPCPFIAILVHLVSGPGVSSLCCAGLTGGATYYLVEMQRKRQSLRDVAGKDFKDDEWSFGQILAVFVWVPVGVAIITVIFRVGGNHDSQRSVRAY